MLVLIPPAHIILGATVHEEWGMLAFVGHARRRSRMRDNEWCWFEWIIAILL
jgi:hypothetical protein